MDIEGMLSDLHVQLISYVRKWIGILRKPQAIDRRTRSAAHPRQRGVRVAVRGAEVVRPDRDLS